MHLHRRGQRFHAGRGGAAIAALAAAEREGAHQQDGVAGFDGVEEVAERADVGGHGEAQADVGEGVGWLGVEDLDAGDGGSHGGGEGGEVALELGGGDAGGAAAQQAALGGLGAEAALLLQQALTGGDLALQVGDVALHRGELGLVVAPQDGRGSHRGSTGEDGQRQKSEGQGTDAQKLEMMKMSNWQTVGTTLGNTTNAMTNKIIGNMR